MLPIAAARLGMAPIGDASKAASIDEDLARKALSAMKTMAEDSIDSMKVSGDYEQLIDYNELPREQALEQARAEASRLAVEAGAIGDTVEIIEVEDVPLAYYPGSTSRVRVKAAGDLA